MCDARGVLNAECVSPDQAAAYLSGALGPNEASQVQRHVDECATCRVLLSELVATSGDRGAPPHREADAGPMARGTQVGRYVVDDIIGAGGMGVVYEARDPELGRTVALKRVRADLEAADEAQARLLREAQALARLSHPNVVAVYDIVLQDRQLFIAMERVHGPHLRLWLSAKPRPWREVLGRYLDAGRGLAAAHRVGVVHRDFKPENVLCEEGGRVCVTDFGLARINAPSEGPPPEGGRAPGDRAFVTHATQWRAGTPAYMAPEQQAGRAADARSDQFSFCVALYEALYGRHPFGRREDPDALLQAKSQGRMPSAPPGSAVPARVHKLLLRGLSVDPAARFESMDATLAALARERPGRARAWAMAACVGLGMCGLAYGWERQRAGASAGLCAGAQAELAGVWDPATRQGLAQAWSNSGLSGSAEAWREVDQAIDTYAQGWAAMHQEACLATQVRGEQSSTLLDLRMACLAGLRTELGALTQVFASPREPVIRRAPSAVRALTPVATCADRKGLLEGVKPPADPAIATQVGALRAQFARVRALLRTDQQEPALAIARALPDAARKVGYRPALAEALLLAGRAQIYLGDPQEAERLLAQAELEADGSGDDRTRASALMDVVYLRAVHEKYEAAGEAARRTEAALDRMGEYGVLRGEFLISLGELQYAQDHFDAAKATFQEAARIASRVGSAAALTLPDALDDLGMTEQAMGDAADAEATLKKAIESAKATLGTRHSRYAAALSHYAQALLDQGRAEEAEPFVRQSLALLEAALGKDSLNACDIRLLLGQTLKDEGRAQEAAQTLSDVLEVERRRGRREVLADIQLALGESYLAAGDAKQALRPLSEAQNAYAAHPDSAVATSSLAEAELGLASATDALDPRRALRFAQSAEGRFARMHRGPKEERGWARTKAWIAAHGTAAVTSRR